MDDKTAAKLSGEIEQLAAQLKELKEAVERVRSAMTSGVQGLALRQGRLFVALNVFTSAWASTTISEQDRQTLNAMLDAAWRGQAPPGPPAPGKDAPRYDDTAHFE